jgi:hypothetical protein
VSIQPRILYRGFARMNADQKRLPELPKSPKIAEIEKAKPTTEARRIRADQKPARFPDHPITR